MATSGQFYWPSVGTSVAAHGQFGMAANKGMEANKLWARGQNTAVLRHRGSLLVALCAGAGLQTGELRRLNRQDILTDGAGVLVHVRGTNARKVPVLREWEDWVADSVSAFPSTELLWGGRRTTSSVNMVNEFTARASGESPNAARLRATWIVGHLRRGTPIKELMIAGGIGKFENLDQYLSFVEPAVPASHRSLLRGGDAD